MKVLHLVIMGTPPALTPAMALAAAEAFEGFLSCTYLVN